MSTVTIVAIDGAAASGKSSTALGVAKRMSFLHVDTGSHYRAVTLACLEAGVSPTAGPELEAFLSSLRLETVVEGPTSILRINGRSPSAEALRGPGVNREVSVFAALPLVRQAVFSYQRGQAEVARLHHFPGLVMEGRDIGTVIFPHTPFKFYLEADEATRIRRRAQEGLDDAIAARDRIDAGRPAAPLTCAPDAVRLDTSALSLETVIAMICARLEADLGRPARP